MPQEFIGVVEIKNTANGTTTIRLDPGTIPTTVIGGTDYPGRLSVRDKYNNQAVFLDGVLATLRVGTTNSPGNLSVRDGAGNEMLNFDAGNSALRLGPYGTPGRAGRL